MGDGEERPNGLVALTLPREGEQLPPQVQVKERRDAEHPAFYAAVERLDKGDAKGLEALLGEHPEVVHAHGYLDEYYPFPHFRGATLLHHVAGQPQRVPLPANIVELTRLLLERGADPNAITLDSTRVLDLVAQAEQPKWLGVRYDLIYAVWKGGREAVEYLLERGAHIDAIVPGFWGSWDEGTAALHRAVEKGDLDMVRLLVEKGADLGVRAANGDTPYLWSTDYDDIPEITRFLKEAEEILLDRAGAAK